MSKSKGNIVDPDEQINKFGADTARLFILFAAPPEKEIEWNDQAVEGSFRFLRRVWTKIQDFCEEVPQRTFMLPMFDKMSPPEKKLYRKTHQTIKKVTEDIEDSYHFNTAISAIMELVNEIYTFGAEGQEKLSTEAQAVLFEAVKIVVVLLSPFCPHICEELWEDLGQKGVVGKIAWPSWDEAVLKEDSVEIVIQINGKVRGRLNVSIFTQAEELEKKILEDKNIGKYIGSNSIKRFVHVPNKLVNLIV
jgi:leucyl-tRNA synthetase